MFETCRLKKSFNKLKQSSHNLRVLTDTFELNNYTYAVVGNFITDTFFNKISNEITIIVDIDYENLRSLMDKYSMRFRVLVFNQFKIIDKREELQTINIWTLNSHRPFKQGFFEKSWENIPQSFYLNDLGCTWVVNKNKLYLGKTKEFIQNKTVDFYDSNFFHSHNIDNKHILVVRLLTYKVENEFILSQTCLNYLKNYISKSNHRLSVRRYIRENKLGLEKYEDAIKSFEEISDIKTDDNFTCSFETVNL